MCVCPIYQHYYKGQDAIKQKETQGGDQKPFYEGMESIGAMGVQVDLDEDY